MEKQQYTCEGFVIHRLRYHMIEILTRTTGSGTVADVLFKDLYQHILSKLGLALTRSLYDTGWRPRISIGFERLVVELWPPDWQ